MCVSGVTRGQDLLTSPNTPSRLLCVWRSILLIASFVLSCYNLCNRPQFIAWSFVMINRSLLALSALAVSVVSVSAMADSLPPALANAGANKLGIVTTGAGAASNPQVYASSYGNFSFGSSATTIPVTAMSGTVQAASSAYGGTDPSVSASAQIDGNPAVYTGGYLTAQAFEQYTFEVTGPDGGFAPVDISSSGSAFFEGPGAGTSGALAELQIQQQGSTSSNSAFEIQEIAAIGTLVPAPAFGTESAEPTFTLNQEYMLANNTPYLVTLSAEAQSNPVSGAFLSSANVDPTIQLDGTATADEHLYFSPNLGAPDSTGTAVTPEPSSLTLLVTGVLGLAGMARRSWAQSC